MTIKWSKGPALAVNWLFLEGQRKESDIMLNWQAGSEKNCREYIIERSVDGRSFTEIERTFAYGSGSVNTYDHLDKDAASINASRIYYRLQRIFHDRSMTYSNMVVIPLGNNAPVVVARPNPFSNRIILDLFNTGYGNTSVQVTLLSLVGGIQYEKHVKLSGSGPIVLEDLPALQPNIYILKVVIGEEVYFFKMARE